MIQRTLIAVFIFSLSACVTSYDLTREPPRFEPATFSNLPGFDQDDFLGLTEAAQKTCLRIEKLPRDQLLKYAGRVSDWRGYCAAIMRDDASMRSIVKTFLVPWRVTVRGSDDGLFTGYYEASLKGSLTQHGPYQTPIRARPLDHVIVNLGDFKPELAGQRVTGQLVGDPGILVLKPYLDRAGVVAGKIPEPADRILAWVDDPVDAFYLEIQGSGRITLDDGSVMHVGYDERNGHPYTAIGRVLIDKGVLTKENTNMQSIRAWLSSNPDKAQAIMNENRSYIFFRQLLGDGPIGGEGVPLTPLRSMAIDHKIWNYGMLFYIDTAASNGDPGEPRLRRLVVGQDTGGAIRGAVRGDLFWGYGDFAAYNAGIMKSRGDLWILLPSGIDPRDYP